MSRQRASSVQEGRRALQQVSGKDCGALRPIGSGHRLWLVAAMAVAVLSACSAIGLGSGDATDRRADADATGWLSPRLPGYQVEEGPALPPPPGLAGATPKTAEPPLPRPAAAAEARVERPLDVALLLPLTGRAANLGASLLEAATLAVFDLGTDAIRVLPRDSAASPDRAAAAAGEAIAAGADIIVGPVAAGAAVSVATTAQPKRVPVISLTADEEALRPGLFMIGFVASDQVRRIARHHARVGGHKIAVLAYDDAYGRASVKALTDVAPSLGLELGAASLLTVGGPEAQTEREVAAFASDIDDADGILLPMPGGRLVQLAPLLAHYGIDARKVRLLGTEVWEHPDLAKTPSLIGARISAPSPMARRAFRDRYFETFGHPPARIAGLAYDAVAMLALLAAGEDPKPFSNAVLTAPEGFAGAEGVFRFRPDGVVERGLAVLEIREDGPIVVEAAPEDFRDPEFGPLAAR